MEGRLRGGVLHQLQPGLQPHQQEAPLQELRGYLLQGLLQQAGAYTVSTDHDHNLHVWRFVVMVKERKSAYTKVFVM